MELETINKLYLELSQVATATTAREQTLLNGIGELRQLAMEVQWELNDEHNLKAAALAQKIENRANDLLP